jgi:hypothetical protein
MPSEYKIASEVILCMDMERGNVEDTQALPKNVHKMSRIGTYGYKLEVNKEIR